MYINNRINNTYTLKVEIRPTLDLQIFATDYYCKRNRCDFKIFSSSFPVALLFHSDHIRDTVNNLSCFILVWRATSPSTARSTFLHSH